MPDKMQGDLQILYRLYRPVLIFFSVYFPVFIRHIARYAPHKN